MGRCMQLLLILLALKLRKSSADCSLDFLPDNLQKLRTIDYYDEFSEYSDSPYYNKWLHGPDIFILCKNLTNLNATTEKLGKNTHLEILNSNLASSQFSDLFKGLKNLKIFNSSIPELKENTFDGFTVLEVLALEGANISVINEKVFSSLKNLATLNMNHNKLVKLNNGSFEGLTNLKSLHLSHNNLSVVEKHAFNQLIKLEELYLSHNDLQTVDTLFSSLNSLKVLDLGANFISKIPLLGPNIMKLYLSDNEIETLDNISELTELMVLDVSHNYLETYDAVGVLYNIHTLNLSSNNIEDLDKSIMSNLTALNNLDISFNSIKNIKIGTFQKNTQLTVFNISDNFLEKITYGMIPKDLHILNLSFNKIRTFKTQVDNIIFLDQKIFLEGNYLKCRDLVEYKKYLYGTSFHTENINGVNCNDEENNEDIISDKAVELLDKKLKESTLYKLLISNATLPRTNEERITDSKLEDAILKLTKDYKPPQQLRNHTWTLSIVNIILTTIIVIILGVILLMLCFKFSYRRLDDAFEFLEN